MPVADLLKSEQNRAGIGDHLGESVERGVVPVLLGCLELERFIHAFQVMIVNSLSSSAARRGAGASAGLRRADCAAVHREVGCPW